MVDKETTFANSITTSNTSNIIAFEALSCGFLFSLPNKRNQNDIKSNITKNSKLTIDHKTVNPIKSID